MFEKILFPVDFSEYSKKSLECSNELKELGAKEVVLLHVIDEKFSEPLRRYSDLSIQTIVERYERDVKARLRDYEKFLTDFKIKSRIEYGEPAEEIMRVAEEESVSLIYMGGRGESWILPRMFGSVAEIVATSSSVPVLFTKFEVVKNGENYCEITFTRLFDKIIYATDFSPTAKRLMNLIEEIGKLSKEIEVVIATGDLKPEKGESYEDFVKNIETKADEIKEKIETSANTSVNVFIIPQEAARAIIDVAERTEASLIAIGANGSGKAKGLGRTADEVLRRSRVPVLLFKG